MNKKAKKNALKQAASSQHALDPNDQAALNRRAERFQREHELERTKHLRIGGQASLKANQQHAHLFNNLSRSGSPLGSSDDPEADPVCIMSSLKPALLMGSALRTSLTGIALRLWEHHKRYSRIIYD